MILMEEKTLIELYMVFDEEEQKHYEKESEGIFGAAEKPEHAQRLYRGNRLRAESRQGVQP